MPLYTPGSVPHAADALAEFLNIELNRIATSLNGAVKLSYGGMVQSIPDTNVSITTTPTVFSGWDLAVPVDRNSGVDITLITGALQVLTAGIYFFSFALTFTDLPNNVQFDFGIYVNGVLERSGRVDPTNQMDRFMVNITSLGEANRGDVIDVRLSSPQGTILLDVGGGSFLIHRISDTFD